MSRIRRGEASGLKATGESFATRYKLQDPPAPLDPATLHGCPRCGQRVLFGREDHGIPSLYCLVCGWEARIAVAGKGEERKWPR